jgi:hypothetical protein
MTFMFARRPARSKPKPEPKLVLQHEHEEIMKSSSLI